MITGISLELKSPLAKATSDRSVMYRLVPCLYFCLYLQRSLAGNSIESFPPPVLMARDRGTLPYAILDLGVMIPYLCECRQAQDNDSHFKTHFPADEAVPFGVPFKSGSFCRRGSFLLESGRKTEFLVGVGIVFKSGRKTEFLLESG